MVNKKDDISTEKRILEAAHKVFVKKGYAAARMEDIAKEAGINRALLHYYFRSKDKMFDIIFNQHFAELLGGLASIIKGDNEFEDRIRNLVNLYHNKFSSHPDLPLFVIHELSQNPDRLVKMISGLPGGSESNLLATRFRTIVQEEVKAGRIKPMDGMQLLINVLGLVLYPFIARPIFQFVMQVSDEGYTRMLKNRQDEIFEFIMNALKP